MGGIHENQIPISLQEVKTMVICDHKDHGLTKELQFLVDFIAHLRGTVNVTGGETSAEATLSGSTVCGSTVCGSTVYGSTVCGSTECGDAGGEGKGVLYKGD